LRRRLTHLIRVFRRSLGALGLRVVGGIFPVQTLVCRCRRQALRLHHRLLRSGVRTVLRTIRCTGQAGISFVLNARHTLTDIEHAMSALAYAWHGNLSDHKEERNEPADLGYRMA
jgi:7-keto-8-aminopelargonate synthetase-like enzyme